MKKKVLFINGHLEVGGCEKSLIDVLKNFDYGKYEVDLLLLEHMGDYYEELPEEVNVKLYSLEPAFGSILPCIGRAIRKKDWFSLYFRILYVCGTKLNTCFMAQMKRLFKGLKTNYDILVEYRPGICTELAAFTFKADKKISWWHHGEMNLSNYEINRLNNAYEKMNAIIAVSDSSAEMLIKYLRGVKEKISVIPNMLDEGELLKKKSQYEPVEFKNTELRLISVGRMSPEKNMKLCPEIGKYLKEMGIEFKWLIVGDGVDKQEVINKIRNYELEESMEVLGRKNNPYPYIANADIMIHPSLVESQGITIMESMALHTPVIAVRSKGPEEFIESGQNGYLVEVDANRIAKLIEDLYRDSKKRKILADNAVHTITQFKPDYIMQKIYTILS